MTPQPPTAPARLAAPSSGATAPSERLVLRPASPAQAPLPAAPASHVAAHLSLVADLASRVAAAPRRETVTTELLPMLARRLHADVATLALVDGPQQLRPAAVVGGTAPSWDPIDVCAATPLAAAARVRAPVLVADVTAAREEFSALAPSASSLSMCAMPLVVGDHLLGVLELEWAHPYHFDAAFVQLLTVVAALTAAALQARPAAPADRSGRMDRLAPFSGNAAPSSGSSSPGAHRS